MGLQQVSFGAFASQPVDVWGFLVGLGPGGRELCFEENTPTYPHTTVVLGMILKMYFQQKV